MGESPTTGDRIPPEEQEPQPLLSEKEITRALCLRADTGIQAHLYNIEVAF